MTKTEILEMFDLAIVDSQKIMPGDFYIAERATGPKLLQCARVEGDLVVPTCNAYPYYIWECIKVVEMPQKK